MQAALSERALLTWPMLLRRVVEAMGALRERKQLDEAGKLLTSSPVEEAKQATEQTLEKLAQDVALRALETEGVSGHIHAGMDAISRLVTGRAVAA